jgi:hypothetical protein
LANRRTGLDGPSITSSRDASVSRILIDRLLDIPKMDVAAMAS